MRGDRKFGIGLRGEYKVCGNEVPVIAEHLDARPVDEDTQRNLPPVFKSGCNGHGGEVYERGTPVIVFDRNINGDTYTARIGVDDVGLGRAAARYAQHLIGTRGKVIEIYGLPGSTPAEDWNVAG